MLYIGIFLGFITLASVSVLLLSFTQTKKFRVVSIKARPEGILAAPKRICLLSDMHFPMCFLNVNDIIDRISAADKDAIMIAGDLTTKHEKGNEKMREFFCKLAENNDCPIFVVLGNHDYGENHSRYDVKEMNAYKKLIEDCGENIKILDNMVDGERIQGSDSRIVIAGISDFRNTSEITAKNVFDEALESANENDTLVVLTHNPDTLLQINDELENSKRDVLVLSGHTHGGQFWLPFNVEFLVLRKDKLPKKGYKYGLYDWNSKTKLFITCGLGESLLPIRFMTTPEIVLIDY